MGLTCYLFRAMSSRQSAEVIHQLDEEHVRLESLRGIHEEVGNVKVAQHAVELYGGSAGIGRDTVEAAGRRGVASSGVHAKVIVEASSDRSTQQWRRW